MMPLELIEWNGVRTTQGALKIMQTDPHGWILVIVSVSVVFCCLLILFAVYSAFGASFTKRAAGKEQAGAPGSAQGGDAQKAAAIALALFLDEENDSAGKETGVITISSEPGKSPWADKSRNFRTL